MISASASSAGASAASRPSRGSWWDFWQWPRSNSLVAIPVEVSGPVRAATDFLLSMAMAAMGLHTNLRHVFKAGVRPLALGLFASAFISLTALILIKFAV